MNVFRSASSVLAVALLAPLMAACGSAAHESVQAQAQADDVKPCDPANPASWHYVEQPMEHGESIIAVVVDGTPVTFDMTCDPREQAYCDWQEQMIRHGNGSADGVLGWVVTNTCALHTEYSYRVMFFDELGGPNADTWDINDAYSTEPPVFAMSMHADVPVFVDAGCSATDGDGLCVAPKLEPSDELTARARNGVAAGDPSNPPLHRR